jgi:hypothetical protein
VAEGTYAVLVGIVQKFGDKDVVAEKEANNVTLREFTVKAAGSQKLVRVTLWPEFAHVPIEAGDSFLGEGKFTQSEGKNMTFLNLSATVVHVNGKKYGKQDVETDEVVNRPAADAEPAF